jgi:hypothetical protein
MVLQLDQETIIKVSGYIETLIAQGAFSPLEADIIRQKYLEQVKQLDIRRLSRTYKTPMKHIKLQIEKTDRKLFNLLKVYKV